MGKTIYHSRLNQPLFQKASSGRQRARAAKDEKQLRKKIERYLKEGRIHSPQSVMTSTYDDCIEKLQKFVDLGCTYFIFNLQTFNEDKEAFMEQIAPS